LSVQSPRARGIRIALKILLSLAVLATLLLLLPWSEVKSAAVRLPGGVWFGVLGGFLAGHAIGVVKWRLMVNAGRAGLEARDATRCYAAGLFANLCLPSIVGGDVLRAALAGKTTGRPEAAVLGGIGDRLSDVMALALLMGVGGILARAELPGWGGAFLTAAILVGAGGAALLSPLLLRRPLSGWPARVRRPLGRTLVALRRMTRSPGTAARVFALSLIIQSAFVSDQPRGVGCARCDHGSASHHLRRGDGFGSRRFVDLAVGVDRGRAHRGRILVDAAEKGPYGRHDQGHPGENTGT
jgi:hypothetical protein